ncbi:MAG: hypothetical protein KAV00_06875 [Phycisphaerae bacterium]|nr:hypothetical protein [Phycisphaerae bacterium]
MRIFGDPSDATLDRKDWVFLGLLPLPFDLAFSEAAEDALLAIALGETTDLIISLAETTDLVIALDETTDLVINLTEAGG